jgi:hypothetical protein
LIIGSTGTAKDINVLAPERDYQRYIGVLIDVRRLL